MLDDPVFGTSTYWAAPLAASGHDLMAADNARAFGAFRSKVPCQAGFPGRG